MEKELTIEDVAKIKAIIPHNMIFEYVDKNQFILEEKHFTWKDGFKQKEVDIFNIDKNDPDSLSEQILVIEFIDSGNKSGHNNIMNKSMTPDALKKLIIKRDDRFKKALRNLIKTHMSDTSNYINNISIKYIPEKMKFIDPMEQMNQVNIESSHKPIPKLIEDFKNVHSTKIKLHSIQFIKYLPRKLSMIQTL